MDTPSSSITARETRERICPYCDDRSIVGLAHVSASTTGLRRRYRCSGCSKDFVLLVSSAPRSLIGAEPGVPGAPIAAERPPVAVRASVKIAPGSTSCGSARVLGPTGRDVTRIGDGTGRAHVT